MNAKINSPRKNPVTLGIFIDGANFYKSLERLKVRRIDYEKLLQRLAGEQGIFIQSWFFTGEPARRLGENEKSFERVQRKFKKFKAYLEKIGFTVVSKKIKYVYDKRTGNCVKQKCDMDSEIKDTVKEITGQEIGVPEKIYFFSGDSDFEEALELLKNAWRVDQLNSQKILLKTKIVVVSDRESLSYELRKKADRIIYLKNSRVAQAAK